jgi:hypothetical protein
MPDEFQYDIFLSQSSKDKAVVHELAARLKADGIRIWLDLEQIKPGDSIPAKIEEGLERSRVLVLCMSANAFGSEWAQLESGTFPRSLGVTSRHLTNGLAVFSFSRLVSDLLPGGG